MAVVGDLQESQGSYGPRQSFGIPHVFVSLLAFKALRLSLLYARAHMGLPKGPSPLERVQQKRCAKEGTPCIRQGITMSFGNSSTS